MLRSAQNVRAILSCWIVLACMCQMVIASDREDVVVLPSPVGGMPSSSLTVEEANVYINERHVSVTYKVTNKLNAALSSLQAIYPPMVEPTGPGMAYPDKHFPEFQILMNGKNLKRFTNASAYLNGKDVTAILKKHHVDPLMVGDDAALIPAKSAQGRVLSPLVKMGLFEPFDENFAPTWQAQAMYSWKQTFPPKSTATMQMKYHARPAFETLETKSLELQGLIALHCAKPEHILQMLQEEQGALPEYLVVERYIVATRFLGHTSSTSTVTIGEKSMLGVKPVMTLACKDDSSVMGRPALRNALINSYLGQISVLVLSFQ